LATYLSSLGDIINRDFRNKRNGLKGVFMEIRQLQYFAQVCKFKNFTRAAEVCFISPQGISLSLKRLEDELGVQLYKRTAHGIELTPDGEYLLPRAKRILEITGDCEQYFGSGKAAEPILHLTLVMGSVEEFAGDVMTEYEEKIGKLKITEKLDYECERDVKDGESELSITLGPVDESVFTQTWLYSTKNVLCMHKDHPLAELDAVSAADIKGVPIVALDPNMRSWKTLEKICRGSGFEPELKQFVDSVMLIFYMAERNQAVGLTTQSLVERMRRPNVVYDPFKDPLFDRDLYLIKRKTATLTPRAAEFERLLITHRYNLGV
jgi:DNA-binding transcriptional LysR family regulator